jgi:hypothetical protein
MDTMGALALATEPPHDGLMLRDPVRKRYGDFLDFWNSNKTRTIEKKVKILHYFHVMS